MTNRSIGAVLSATGKTLLECGLDLTLILFDDRHPLSTEKLLILSINEGKEIASKGKVSLSGCPLQ